MPATDLDSWVIIDDQAPLVENLRQAREAARRWAKIAEDIGLTVRELIGSAPGATIDGKPAVELRPRAGQAKVDLEKLTLGWPEAYQACVSWNPPSTTLALLK